MGKEKKIQPLPDYDLDKVKSLTLFSLFKYSDSIDFALLACGSFFSIGAGVGMPLMMLFMGDFFSAGAGSTSYRESAEKQSTIMFIVTAALAVCQFIYHYCLKLVSERQIRRIRAKYFRAILRQDITWFDHVDPKSLSTRIIDDTTNMQKGMGSDLGMFLQSLSQFLAGYIIGFTKDWRLTLVVMALGIPIIIVVGFLMKWMRNIVEKVQQAYAESGSVAEEAVGSIKTVSTFNLQKLFIGRYQETILAAEKFGIKNAIIGGVTFGSMMLIMFTTYGVGLWFGSFLIYQDRDALLSSLDGILTNTDTCPINYVAGDFTPCVVANLTSLVEEGFTECASACKELLTCFAGNTCANGGSVLVVFFSVLMGTMGLSMIGPALVSITTALGSGSTVYYTIDRIPEIDTAVDKGELPQLDGNIEFRDIHFRYPSRKDVEILKGMNLIIPAGKTVGLVGSSGCGKSTTLQLLQRYYDPEGGEVLLNGINIKECNLKYVRSHMGYVGQEPALFSGTIADNIRCFDEKYSMEDVEKAAMESNAHCFIKDFPDGYNTFVGEGGHSLSGGQKQRIAIARAIIRNPQILLLDEATSALDSESERIVQEALDKLLEKSTRTTIVIAHRLSTIEHADLIVVFNNGVIGEMGTHKELMAKNGLYAELKRVQELKSVEPIGESEDHYLVRYNSERRSSHRSHEEEIKELEAKPDVPFSRLIKMSKPEYNYMGIGVLTGALSGAINPCFALLMSEMFGLYFKFVLSDMKTEAVYWCLGLVGMGIALFIVFLSRSYSFGVVGEKLTTRLRGMCFEAYMKQEVGYFEFEENNTGAITSRLAQDATFIRRATGEQMASYCQTVFTVIVGMTIAFASHALLTLVCLVFVPFLIASSIMNMRVMRRVAFELKKPLEEAGALSSECFNTIRTVQTFSLEDTMSYKYDTKLLNPYNLGKKDALVGAFVQAAVSFFSMATYALAIRVGGIWVETKGLDQAKLMRVMMSVLMTAQGVSQSTSQGGDTIKLKEAAKSVFGILDRETIIDPTNEGGINDGIQGAIEFKNVWFRYPSRPKVLVLKDFSIKIEKGQKVALVGPSGCGKSTLVGLLQRYYEPESGEIYIDGINITEYNISYLRSCFGVVGQEPVLFTGSVSDNIRMGLIDCEVSMEQVEQASKASNSYNFIQDFPDKFDTKVGNKGEQLSGGQKQRIAIARSILRDPKILLLDEATSALDTESEKIVQEALDQLLISSSRTSIVVAHRLSTIQNSDVIFTLENGRLKETGTHKQLLALKGLYYTLASRQV